MRSPDDRSTKEELELRKRRLTIDLAAVDLELRRLSLREDEERRAPIAISELFPLHNQVRVTNLRDPAGLHDKVATVTGHTKARVRITRKGIEYLRAPSSLKLLK
jgi:hypothetical protein